MRILTLITALLFCNITYAHNTEPIVVNPVFPPVVTVPMQPSVTYVIPEVKRPTIVYRWVPVYVNRPVTVINHNRLFSKHQEVVYQSVIEWVYQPYYIY